MIVATLGFVYKPSLTEVLLITKSKPKFHQGKLNGLGGKREAGESDRECLTREVKEEANIHIAPTNWVSMGVLDWENWHVTIFATIYTEHLSTIENRTIDSVSWYSVDHLPENTVENIRWLIPLGIDVLTNLTPPIVAIHYH